MSYNQSMISFSIIIIGLFATYVRGCPRCCTRGVCTVAIADYIQSCKTVTEKADVLGGILGSYGKNTKECNPVKVMKQRGFSCDKCEPESPVNKRCKKNFSDMMKNISSQFMVQFNRVVGGIEKVRKDLYKQHNETLTWIRTLGNNMEAQFKKTMDKLKVAEEKILNGIDDVKKEQKIQEGLLADLKTTLLDQFTANQAFFKNELSNTEKILLHGQNFVMSDIDTVSKKLDKMALKMRDIQGTIDTWKVKAVAMKSLKLLRRQILEYRPSNDPDWGKSLVKIERYPVTGIINQNGENFINWLRRTIEDGQVANAVQDVFTLIIGSEWPMPPDSIFAVDSHKQCSMEHYEQLMFLINQGVRYHKFAIDYVTNSTHTNLQKLLKRQYWTHTTQFELESFDNEFTRLKFEADESYGTNCKCPKGFQLFKTKYLKKLIPGLKKTNTISTFIDNLVKVTSNSNASQLAKKKAGYILNAGLKTKNPSLNFEPTDAELARIDYYSWEDVQWAIQVFTSNKQELTKNTLIGYKDDVKSCISETNNYISCKVNNRPGNGLKSGSCSYTNKEKCFPWGCEKYPCPKGWEEKTGQVEPLKYVDEKISNMDCADKCEKDANCQSFMYCGKNCDEGDIVKPYESHCILGKSEGPTTGAIKRNFALCVPEGWMKLEKGAVGTWKLVKSGHGTQTFLEDVPFVCMSTSDEGLNCGGRTVISTNTTDVQLPDNDRIGRYEEGKDGQKKIFWENGEIWEKEGPISYQCYNYNDVDERWRHLNNASNKQMCERHSGNVFQTFDASTPGCDKSCSCCKVHHGNIFKPKMFGKWKNGVPCISENESINCGAKEPGKQLQTRECVDGTVDICLPGEKRRIISCREAKTALPECIGQTKEYHLPKVGESCINSVTNSEDCREAARHLEEATYQEEVRGNSASLPYGCIFDKVDVQNPYVYLNLNGKVISEDKDLQPICYN